MEHLLTATLALHTPVTRKIQKSTPVTNNQTSGEYPTRQWLATVSFLILGISH